MYITSDLHFLHKKVSEFCPTYRKWDHLHEMTEGLISVWNEKAKTPGTKMYHLGDFCFGTPEETDFIASRLNGDITFIVGNHDYSKHRQVLEKYGEVKYYDEVKYGKKFFVLCHYPIASWNKQGRGYMEDSFHGLGNWLKIIVSNTTTTEKELKPYIDLAEEYGYKVVSLIVENRHGNDSIHNVPQEIRDSQENRLRNSLKLQ